MPKMDKKIISISILIFFACIIPLSYVHELGHGYICMMEGYEFDIELGVDGGRMICYGEVDNLILFRAIGGILAGSAAFFVLYAVAVSKPDLKHFSKSALLGFATCLNRKMSHIHKNHIQRKNYSFCL